METLGKRIARHRKAAGLSQAALAVACGWKSQSRIGNYESDSREPSLSDLENIARAVGVSVAQLTYGLPEQGSGPQQAQTATHSAPTESAARKVLDMLDSHGQSLSPEARQQIICAAEATSLPQIAPLDGEILIPLYDIRAAMGHGQVPPDYTEALRNVVINEAVLYAKGITRTNTTQLAIITGWGQSMEGTINDKDPVIVDRSINTFTGEGIYVVTWGGLLYIKRLQMVDAENIWLISDNPHHKSQTVRLDEVIIHARVLLVWNARKL